MHPKRLERNLAEILIYIGADSVRDLTNTPRRMLDAYSFACRGVSLDPLEALGQATVSAHTGTVLIEDIPVMSTCEHHFLPFTGSARVSYVPKGAIAGFGRIARLVDVLAGRPQIQERLTAEIADALEAVLGPESLTVSVTCQHACMFLGAGSSTQTSVTTTEQR